jgi:hypothetical protein
MTFEAREGSEQGQDFSLPYSSNAFLCAHNAFANFADGFIYGQQTYDLRSQLAMGAWALMLDIWDYGDDVYLFHEDQRVLLQPFGQYQSLAVGLGAVAEYLQEQPNMVITIIFEDRVKKNRPKIQAAFQANAMGQGRTLWDEVFFADRTNQGWNVATQGWPRVVVFSSQSNPFPRQWGFMSESVYGDESLDPATWVNPRKESQGLDQFPLSLLNHFPTWSLLAVKPISGLIALVTTANAGTLIDQQVAACQSRWHRLPNFLAFDFFEIPSGAPSQAIGRLNEQLHPKT